MRSNLYDITIPSDKRQLYVYDIDNIKTFSQEDTYVKISKTEYVSNSYYEGGKPLEVVGEKYLQWLIRKIIYRELEKTESIINLDVRSGTFGVSSNALIRKAEYSILRNCAFRIIELYDSSKLMIDSYPKLYNRLKLNKLINEYGVQPAYIVQKCSKALVYVEHQGQRKWMPGLIRDVIGKSALIEIPNVFDGTISVVQNRVLPLLRVSDYSQLTVSGKITKALEADLKTSALDTIQEKAEVIGEVFKEIFLPILNRLADQGKISFVEDATKIPSHKILKIDNSSLPAFNLERQGKRIQTKKLLQGLSKFSINENVKEENVVVFFKEEDRNKIKDLILKLNTGIKSGDFTFSLPRKFGIKLKIVKHYAIPNNSNYLNAIKTYLQSSSDDIREALVLCYLPYQSEIYYQVKALLASKGRMSQVVSRPSFDIYSCWNIASNLYAKLGYIPWSIEGYLDDPVDLVLGLSYSSLIHKGRLRRNIGHVNVFDRHGVWKFMKSNSEYLSFENRHREIPKLINNAISDYLSTSSDLNLIDIHFSKKISGKERKLIFEKISSEYPSIDQVNLISLNTGHYYQLFSNNSNGKVPKGTIVLLNDNQFLLSTSSNRNANKLIEVTVWRNNAQSLNEADISSVARKILIMTMLNWKSTVKETTEPVTTKFSNEVARLTNYFNLTEWKEVNDNLSTLPWFI